MKEKDNIINNYKNIKIELSVLDEREIYLKELLEGIQNRRVQLKETCTHPLFVYFGRSYYNFESRNTHVAKCICCGQSKFFKADTPELVKFKKSKKVLDLTEFINPVENFLIPNSTWYEETFEKIRIIVDEVVFSKEKMEVYELKSLVKEHFEKENNETIKKLEKINKRVESNGL